MPLWGKLFRFKEEITYPLDTSHIISLTVTQISHDCASFKELQPCHVVAYHQCTLVTLTSFKNPKIFPQRRQGLFKHLNHTLQILFKK